jgi:predicted nucleic acid-binding protein
MIAPLNDIVIAVCAVNHDLELEHCDSHFEKILPVAAKL